MAKVDGEGFKLDVARLLTHSTVLQQLLGDTDGHIGQPGEGTEENPIKLDKQCTAAQLANFFGWLYHEYVCPNCILLRRTEFSRDRSWADLPIDHIQQLVDILHVSHMWGVAAGINFASERLLRFEQAAFRSARRLRLALLYGLNSWVEGAVRDLLQTPLPLLTVEDKRHLGFRFYVAIAEAQSAICFERQRLAAAPPAPPTVSHDIAPFCPCHEVCKQIWAEVWYLKITRAILRERNPIALKDVPDALDALDHPNMNPECKTFFMNWLRSCNLIMGEEEVTSDLVAQIRASID